MMDVEVGGTGKRDEGGIEVVESDARVTGV
jgi:hypothetical protein